MKLGVPIDVAFAMDPHEVMAWLIVDGENEGQEFDWGSNSWVGQT